LSTGSFASAPVFQINADVVDSAMQPSQTEGRAVPKMAPSASRLSRNKGQSFFIKLGCACSGTPSLLAGDELAGNDGPLPDIRGCLDLILLILLGLAPYRSPETDILITRSGMDLYCLQTVAQIA
jgi:hypothetical protein